MFYDNSEEVLPNWWDALDRASDSRPVGDTRPADHAGIRQVDRDGVVIQTGSSEAVDAADRGDQEESPAEKDNGPLYPDGYCYCYRYSGLNDPHVREASEASEASEAAASKLPLLSSGYDRDVIRNVWEFAEVVPGNDPDLWRKDEFGNWIYRLDYGRRTSEFGWEIFDPGVGRHCQGVYAMRPMQWQSFVSQYEVMG